MVLLDGSHTKSVAALFRTESIENALFWAKLHENPQIQMLFKVTLMYVKLKLKVK